MDMISAPWPQDPPRPLAGRQVQELDSDDVHDPADLGARCEKVRIQNTATSAVQRQQLPVGVLLLAFRCRSDKKNGSHGRKNWQKTLVRT
jgi:hypothetical protein